MKKFIIPIAIYTGTFIVLNVGMYFLLRMTQPKSELLAGVANADSSVAEQSMHAEDGALDSAHTQEHMTIDSDSLSASGKTLAGSHGNETGEEPLQAVNTGASKTDGASLTEAETPGIVEESNAKSGEQGNDLAEADSADMNLLNEEDVLAATPKSTAEITKLAKLLEGMKPNEAAVIAERLPTETIVQLVMRMKSRSGAKMMASLPVPVAASVATRMAELSGVKNPS